MPYGKSQWELAYLASDVELAQNIAKWLLQDTQGGTTAMWNQREDPCIQNASHRELGNNQLNIHQNEISVEGPQQVWMIEKANCEREKKASFNTKKWLIGKCKQYPRDLWYITHISLYIKAVLGKEESGAEKYLGE